MRAMTLSSSTPCPTSCSPSLSVCRSLLECPCLINTQFSQPRFISHMKALGGIASTPSWFLLPSHNSLDLKDAPAESCPLSSLTPLFLVLSHRHSRAALSGTYVDIFLAHHLVAIFSMKETYMSWDTLPKSSLLEGGTFWLVCWPLPCALSEGFRIRGHFHSCYSQGCTRFNLS